MRTKIKLLLFFVFTILAASSGYSFAHGGGLDSYGCHNDRKHGGYHCHRGKFAGQSFSSKAEMLQAMNKPTGKSGNEKSKK